MLLVLFLGISNAKVLAFYRQYPLLFDMYYEITEDVRFLLTNSDSWDLVSLYLLLSQLQDLLDVHCFMVLHRDFYDNIVFEAVFGVHKIYKHL